MNLQNNESLSWEQYYMLRLEKFAFFLGAAAIPCTFITPIAVPSILGSMAIMFAVLSKGGGLHFSRLGRTAAILGAVAIIVNVVYLGIVLSTLKGMLADPAGRQQLSDMLYHQYGMTLDELLPQLSVIPLFQ